MLGRARYQDRYLLYSSKSRPPLKTREGAKKICKVEFTIFDKAATWLKVVDRALGLSGPGVS